MAEDKHDFSLFRKDYAHPEAEDRFLTIDQQWLERQLVKNDLKTIIVDNTNKARAFSVCSGGEMGRLALKLENPTAEDMVCLGLSLFKIPTAIICLKFRNVNVVEQVPPAVMLLKVFFNRKLECIFLEKDIVEDFALEIFKVAHIGKKIRLCCSNMTDKAITKLHELDNLAIDSDDESDMECAAASAATRAGR